uniref:Putative secreted protein n=1 Tax=Ixodes ricinus TaxID=34613 RepID=A0A6B0V2M5_IXORI
MHIFVFVVSAKKKVFRLYFFLHLFCERVSSISDTTKNGITLNKSTLRHHIRKKVEEVRARGHVGASSSDWTDWWVGAGAGCLCLNHTSWSHLNVRTRSNAERRRPALDREEQKTLLLALIGRWVEQTGAAGPCVCPLVLPVGARCSGVPSRSYFLLSLSFLPYKSTVRPSLNNLCAVQVFPKKEKCCVLAVLFLAYRCLRLCERMTE